MLPGKLKIIFGQNWAKNRFVRWEKRVRAIIVVSKHIVIVVHINRSKQTTFKVKLAGCPK